MDRNGESELVQRASAGDTAALQKLLELHDAALIRFIQRKLPDRLRGQIEPEDVAQAVYVETYRTIGRFKPTGQNAFFRWLTAIAKQRVLDELRKRDRLKRGGGRRRISHVRGAVAGSTMTLLDLIAVDSKTPTRSIARREAAAELNDALAELATPYREALRLRYIDGLSVEETARRLGRTAGAVQNLCWRALQKLREALGDG